MVINLNKLSVFLISIGFFLSQFYFLPGGYPQFSHVFIVLAIAIFFYLNTSISYKDSIFLIIFVFYVCFINISHSIYNGGDISFIISTIYWVFNLILFLALTGISFLNFKKLIFLFKYVLIFSLIMSVVIWFLGGGRYDFSPRYNGYFNDPNQMAFWVLCSCAIGLILFNNLKLKIIIYSLSFFLILLTMSRSATIGFLILTLGLIFQHKSRLDLKIIFSLISLLVASTSFFILLKFGFLDSIITRFSEGVESNDQQASSRGFNALIDYPEHLMFGAGQGAYYLFSPTNHEIHSTWLGILYYYGVIGFFLFVSFLYNIFKRLNFAEKIIFLGPMFYGFFTYNARTLAFWFLVAVFLLYSKYREQL